MDKSDDGNELVFVWMIVPSSASRDVGFCAFSETKIFRNFQRNFGDRFLNSGDRFYPFKNSIKFL